MEEILTVSEIIGISDHLGGFLLRRGCPGEKAWFLPRSTPTVGSLTRFVPQPQTPPGLTTSPQASLPAMPCRRSFNIKDFIRRQRRHRAASPSRYAAGTQLESSMRSSRPPATSAAVALA